MGLLLDTDPEERRAGERSAGKHLAMTFGNGRLLRQRTPRNDMVVRGIASRRAQRMAWQMKKGTGGCFGKITFGNNVRSDKQTYNSEGGLMSAEFSRLTRLIDNEVVL